MSAQAGGWIEACHAAWADEAKPPLPAATVEDVELALGMERQERERHFWTFALARLWQMVEHGDRSVIDAGRHWREAWPDITDNEIRAAKNRLPPPRPDDGEGKLGDLEWK